MVKAELEGVVLAESDKTIVVEGNHYFPPGDVKKDLFTDSATHTTCGWKGVASYYNAKLPNGKVVNDAAWYYPDCKEKAKNIENYVAFYKNKVNVA
ncbi:DUF427-domain-containing protein [Cystobasidium minutum MCA 4210]|uniref:DUF427-domain-containing protein n=1 Tax=Cystobasidium minutum MCA 4210 TaxID=1397322 RepID=UPI0034D01390|eukprot:jgi/Rhomi1/170265/fgenesh1_kg.3_\